MDGQDDTCDSDPERPIEVGRAIAASEVCFIATAIILFCFQELDDDSVSNANIAVSHVSTQTNFDDSAEAATTISQLRGQNYGPVFIGCDFRHLSSPLLIGDSELTIPSAE